MAGPGLRSSRNVRKLLDVLLDFFPDIRSDILRFPDYTDWNSAPSSALSLRGLSNFWLTLRRATGYSPTGSALLWSEFR